MEQTLSSANTGVIALPGELTGIPDLSGVLDRLVKSFHSVTAVTEAARIAEEEGVVSLEKRLDSLKNDIGDNLFYALSPLERKAMAETAGIIDLGPDVSIDRIYRFIEDDEEYYGRYIGA